MKLYVDPFSKIGIDATYSPSDALRERRESFSSPTPSVFLSAACSGCEKGEDNQVTFNYAVSQELPRVNKAEGITTIALKRVGSMTLETRVVSTAADSCARDVCEDLSALISGLSQASGTEYWKDNFSYKIISLTEELEYDDGSVEKVQKAVFVVTQAGDDEVGFEAPDAMNVLKSFEVETLAGNYKKV